MNKKAQELELRNIMQGLEEFATFMSFKGNAAGLRILSVESVTQSEPVKPTNRIGQVVKLYEHSSQSNQQLKQTLRKSPFFQDRNYH